MSLEEPENLCYIYQSVAKPFALPNCLFLWKYEEHVLTEEGGGVITPIPLFGAASVSTVLYNTCHSENTCVGNLLILRLIELNHHHISYLKLVKLCSTLCNNKSKTEKCPVNQ